MEKSLKVEGARRQLGTALALYLQDADPVSIHCLAGGGCEVIEFYAEKAGAEPFATHMLNTAGLTVEDLRRIQRKYWNAFKHATRRKGRAWIETDDEELLSKFSDEQNDHALFIGWWDYVQATKVMPVEAQAFQAWYLAKHPEKLSPERSPDPFDALFPGLRSLPRAEQKRHLRERIEQAKSDPEVMNDPRTEPRPLILPWPEPIAS